MNTASDDQKPTQISKKHEKIRGDSPTSGCSIPLPMMDSTKEYLEISEKESQAFVMKKLNEMQEKNN